MRKDSTGSVFFLIDPLDGTREFLERNGEFTVNIALVEDGLPCLGIIHAPALGMTYFAEKIKGAYKLFEGKITALRAKPQDPQTLRVVTSRSHINEDTRQFLDQLTLNGQTIALKPIGSALKFGLLAEGLADLYPRLAPTMEWDTAAGHAIINEIGGKVLIQNTQMPLQYNKAELVNPGFVALANEQLLAFIPSMSKIC